MAETLLQKAQRLGIQPAAKPVVASSSGESLIQKAQRLGIQPAKPVEKKPGLFSLDTLKGKTTYQADTEGGAKTIAPNIVRTFGNIPSSAAKLARAIVSPVNPLDTDSPISIPGNIVRSTVALSDMMRNKRHVNEVLKQNKEREEQLTRQRGTTFVPSNNTSVPEQKKTSLIKDTAGGFIDTVKKGWEMNKTLGEKIYNNLKTNTLGEDSVLKGLGISGAQGVSKVAETAIEDPLLIPSLIYGGPKAAGAKGDAISDTARIFTRGKNTSIPNIIRNVIPSKAGAIDDLEQTYTDLMSGTTPGKKKIDKIAEKTAALDRAGTTGRTPQRTLAESGVIPNRSGPKLDTYDQAKQYRETTAPLREANRKALEEVGLSSSPVKLDDLEARAIANAKTPQNVNGGRFEIMEKQIQTRFTALRKAYPSGEIPLSVVDDIKSAHWDNVFGNKSLVEADRLAKDSDYSIAKAMQKDIEEIAEQAGHSEVAQLNREIGDRLEAARFLEDLNGKTIKGGRLLKYVTTGIGSAMGTTVPGKIIGALGGNLVGELIIANNVANPIKRFLLRDLKAKDPEAYTQTIEWLKRQDLDRETRLLLPSPSGLNTQINQGRPLPMLPKNGSTIETTGKDITGGSTAPASAPKSNSPVKPLDDIRIYEPYQEELPVIKMGPTPVPVRSILPEAIGTPKVFTPPLKEPYLRPEEMPVIEAGDIPKNRSTLPKAIGAPKVYQSKSPISQQTKPAITKVTNKPIRKTIPSKPNVSKEEGKIGILPLTLGAIGATGAGVIAIDKALSERNKETYIKEVSEKPKVDTPKLITAIKYNESRGEKEPYSFSQPSGTSTLGHALGAYQITEGELKTYAKRYLGKVVTAAEFLASPELQDEYIKNKIEALAKRGLSVEEIMAVHNKGASDLTPEGLAKVKEKAKEYIKSGMDIYVTK